MPRRASSFARSKKSRSSASTQRAYYALAITIALSTIAPCDRSTCAQSSSVAPVVTTSSSRTAPTPCIGSPRHAKRPRAERRASRFRPRCRSPAICTSPAQTRTPLSAQTLRAISSQPSKPRSRRRAGVVGTGTSVLPASTISERRVANPRATSRRPFFSARTAWRRLPSYGARLKTRRVGKRTVAAASGGKQRAQIPLPGASHPPH